MLRNSHIHTHQGHKSYSQDFLHNLPGIVSLVGTVLGTKINYKRDLHVHCYGPLNKEATLLVAHVPLNPEP